MTKGDWHKYYTAFRKAYKRNVQDFGSIAEFQRLTELNHVRFLPALERAVPAPLDLHQRITLRGARRSNIARAPRWLWFQASLWPNADPIGQKTAHQGWLRWREAERLRVEAWFMQTWGILREVQDLRDE